MNEDAIGARPDLGLFLLCDGLGGYNAGEIAATMATSSLVSSLAADLELAQAAGAEFDPRKAGLTRDHSFSQELLDAGMVTAEEAKILPSKNLVTRALGAGEQVEPEVNDYPLRVGDVLLLCSDGLTEMIDDAQIARAIFGSVPDVQRAAQRLVELANAAGGRDNVSVVVIRLAGRKGLEPRRIRGADASPPPAPSG